jgi:ABC-type sugar transport system substrate-binding protein
MKLMTAITLGIFAIGGVAFAAKAGAQTSRTTQPCKSSEPREVSLYFERDQAQLNDFSKTLVDRVASEAKNCGLTQVVAETRIDAKRAAVISDTFKSRGVRVILVSPAMTQATGDDVAARAAKLRLTLSDRIG